MIRRTVSLTTLFSFLLILLSSIILYIQPEGRVAYWSDWTAFCLSKEEWNALHITGGVLFLLCCLWHALLNLRPILSYMKKSGKGGLIPAMLSLVLCGIVYAGTMNGWQPMSGILELNEHIKRHQESVYGAPPYGHAELSTLKRFCTLLQLDTPTIAAGLRAEGLKGEISGKSTLLDMARANDISPAALYRTILKVADLTEQEAAKLGAGRREKGLKKAD